MKNQGFKQYRVTVKMGKVAPSFKTYRFNTTEEAMAFEKGVQVTQGYSQAQIHGRNFSHYNVN